MRGTRIPPRGGVVFRAPVAVGAPGTRTPGGRFYVRDRLSGFASPMYGPLAFGTNARSPTLTDWPGGGLSVFMAPINRIRSLGASRTDASD